MGTAEGPTGCCPMIDRRAPRPVWLICRNALAPPSWITPASCAMPGIYLSSSITSMPLVFSPSGASTQVTSTTTAPTPPLARAA